ncbi:hypothetical protein [Martelella radicis]|uniref:Uncharacterized protein n=1 Tax=Martelella radicis TaxID=1397476 RepID=A0A7W6KR17_9HYPH|nr:hypothetical protein [Martelella radicis]MBB4124388.1 hypothetical protein [Martelella radicis]
MFEYLPLIAFQTVFAAAGLTILYRMVGGVIQKPATKPALAGRRGHSAEHGRNRAAA